MFKSSCFEFVLWNSFWVAFFTCPQHVYCFCRLWFLLHGEYRQPRVFQRETCVHHWNYFASNDPHPYTLFRHSFWHTIWKYSWHIYIYSEILPGILSGIYSDILSDIELRSGSAHWDLELAVGREEGGGGRKEGGRGRTEPTLIKSRGPHLAGGQKWTLLKYLEIFSATIQGRTDDPSGDPNESMYNTTFAPHLLLEAAT